MTEPDSTARPEETSVDAPFDKSSSPAVTFRPPPWYVLLIVLGSVGVITAAQMTDVLGDRAIANILTLILGFISVVTFSIWFSVHSQLPRTVRLGYAVAVLGAFAAFIACFRISGVYGDLVPKFRLRFSRDVEMTRATSEAQVTVFIEPSGRDFPQFLGPHRNGVVSDVELIDWNKSKPTELWRKRVGAGWSPFSVLGDYAATMEQRGDGEVVACYRIRTGEEIWSQVTPGRHYSFFGGLGPRTAPSWDGQRLYTLGGFGALQCLEGATGKVIWRDDLLKRYKLTPEVDQTIVFWGRANSPLVVDDLVVVPAGGT
ncbi:MAG: PQQ-binding-like beta-propeller repeat protein, partial [Pirellulaceae bacterium]|nr:PQQ-binding-like beta-propeller repeat protein [Pirellulaceae bacterium]